MRKAYVKNNQAALYGIMLREVLIMYIDFYYSFSIYDI